VVPDAIGLADPIPGDGVRLRRTAFGRQVRAVGLEDRRPQRGPAQRRPRTRARPARHRTSSTSLEEPVVDAQLDDRPACRVPAHDLETLDAPGARSR
jgi:hypothetical protein